MSTLAKQFTAGAFALIGLFLVLSHYTGAGRVLGALGSNGSLIFKTLQGR
jgi:hypothetical protein